MNRDYQNPSVLSRLVVRTISISLTILAAQGVSGQDFPNKPIHIVTGETAGGLDLAARLITPGLLASMGQQVIVENRGFAVGPVLVAKARPDGYTLLLYGTPFWLAPSMNDVSYDPVKDFAPITLISTAPTVLVVHPSVAANSVKELIALAVTSARPSTLFPGLPTMASSDLPGFQAGAQIGIFAPAGTPPTIINRLYQEIVQVLNKPDVKQKFFSGGAEVVGSTPQEFDREMKSDMAVSGKLIKEAGIRGE